MQLSRHATGGHVPPQSGIVATPLAPQTPSPRTAPAVRAANFCKSGTRSGSATAGQAR